MMLLPIILVVVLVSLFLNSSSRGNNRGFIGNEPTNNALDILDKRFANGEISEEEYLKRRSVLRDRYDKI